ncbi:MAG: glutathione S-transferase family protein [Pseudomonadota bacterium]
MTKDAPLRLYGAKISYYTGKMEAYLRYKEIPFEFVTLNREGFRFLLKNTGTSQMPAIELPDGRVMTDTTPMIAWLEREFPEPVVIPSDPVVAFFSRLIEDYAEEWLWRPAMHYRWSYRKDRLHLGRKIVDEVMTDIAAPGFIKRAMIRYRQHTFYVKRDGVSKETWDHVESIYLKTLDRLEAIFAVRPYLLGERPSLADFGFFASMFRHFSQDPTASDIMRDRAPGVYEWQARLWNARASRVNGPLPDRVPADWSPFLDDIGAAYLPFLNANAIAWQKRQERFDIDIEGVPYRQVPTSQYRVWCLEELRRHFNELAPVAREKAQSMLETHGVYTPLFALEQTASGYDRDGKVPFHGVKVHYQSDN